MQRVPPPGTPPLLPAPETLDTLPDHALAAIVAQCAALQSRAAARLLTRRERPPDRLLDLEEAATRLATTPDWLGRQRDLPFRVEVSAGQIRWSEQGLDAWIAGKQNGGGT